MGQKGSMAANLRDQIPAPLAEKIRLAKKAAVWDKAYASQRADNQQAECDSVWRYI